MIVRCGSCGRQSKAPDNASGSRRCPACGEPVELRPNVAAEALQPPSVPLSPPRPPVNRQSATAFASPPAAPNGSRFSEPEIVFDPRPLEFVESIAHAPPPSATRTADTADRSDATAVAAWRLPQGLWIAIFLAVGLLAANVAYTSGRLSPSPRWEYRIEAPSDYLFTSRLNELGEDGWELVTARRASSGDHGPMEYEMIFKRPAR